MESNEDVTVSEAEIEESEVQLRVGLAGRLAPSPGYSQRCRG